MRLWLHMGWKSLAEGLEANSSRDLEELRIYAEVYEPFGDQWGQTAIVANTVARMGGAKTTPRQFMPLRKAAVQSPESIESFFKSLVVSK